MTDIVCENCEREVQPEITDHDGSPIGIIKAHADEQFRPNDVVGDVLFTIEWSCGCAGLEHSAQNWFAKGDVPESWFVHNRNETEGESHD